MSGEHLLLLLTLFLVTLADHSGVPNLYFVTMVLSQVKHLNPWLLFLSAAASIFVYEQSLYAIGRFLHSRQNVDHPFLRPLMRGAERVSHFLTKGNATWLVTGRFVAYIGLYVPFAYGQRAYPYVRYTFWTGIGTALQLTAFGIPAYALGRVFREFIDEEFVERIPLGLISVAMMLVVGIPVGWQTIRKLRRERNVGALTDTTSGEQSGNHGQEHESDHRGEV